MTVDGKSAMRVQPGQSGRKTWSVPVYLVLLCVILVAAGVVLFYTGGQHGNTTEGQHGDEPLTGLPWQIDRLPDGATRVFGITLGQTTLRAAIDQLGDDMDLAIIASPHETGTLEAYYSHYSAGPITGSLILVMDIAPDVLLDMRERGGQHGGTRRFHLHPDDLPSAFSAPVKVITFLPSFDLDEAIAQARFGAPATVVQVTPQQQHLLYPELGLDLVLNTDGKDVLQYLLPRDFSAHRVRLQQASATGE